MNCTYQQTAETRHGRPLWRCSTCGKVCLGDRPLPSACGRIDQAATFADLACRHRGAARTQLVAVPGGCCGSPTVEIEADVADCLHRGGACEIRGRGGLLDCSACGDRSP